MGVFEDKKPVGEVIKDCPAKRSKAESSPACLLGVNYPWKKCLGTGFEQIEVRPGRKITNKLYK